MYVEVFLIFRHHQKSVWSGSRTQDSNSKLDDSQHPKPDYDPDPDYDEQVSAPGVVNMAFEPIELTEYSSPAPVTWADESETHFWKTPAEKVENKAPEAKYKTPICGQDIDGTVEALPIAWPEDFKFHTDTGNNQEEISSCMETPKVRQRKLSSGSTSKSNKVMAEKAPAQSTSTITNAEIGYDDHAKDLPNAGGVEARASRQVKQPCPVKPPPQHAPTKASLEKAVEEYSRRRAERRAAKLSKDVKLCWMDEVQNLD